MASAAGRGGGADGFRARCSRGARGARGARTAPGEPSGAAAAALAFGWTEAEGAGGGAELRMASLRQYTFAFRGYPRPPYRLKCHLGGVRGGERREASPDGAAGWWPAWRRPAGRAIQGWPCPCLAS